jgi:hypothetical protein
MNCVSQYTEGGNNYQWPIKKPSGSIDTSLCTASIIQTDPNLSYLSDNGCITNTITATVSSGADSICGNRVMGQSVYSFDLNGNPIPRSNGVSTLLILNQNTTQARSRINNSFQTKNYILIYFIILLVCFA